LRRILTGQNEERIDGPKDAAAQQKEKAPNVRGLEKYDAPGKCAG